MLGRLDTALFGMAEMGWIHPGLRHIDSCTGTFLQIYRTYRRKSTLYRRELCEYTGTFLQLTVLTYEK